jgi:phosphoglycerate kinase
MKKFTIKNFPLEGEKVFLRVDYNVPMKNKKIVDDSKIKQSLPTIKYLLKNHCTIIIGTHLGRPKGKIVSELKTQILAKKLKELLPKIKITKLNDCIGKDIKKKIEKSQRNQIFILENLRFYKEEEENDLTFSHSLANLATYYVNDAFAVNHRKHASINAITKFLPSCSGLLLEKEINELNKALQPKKPAIWIMGGAKLNKVNLINQALLKADYVLIGGALAFSFLKAQGIKTGYSKSDSNSIRIAKKILSLRKAKKIILPLDFITTEELSPKAKTKIVDYNKIEPQQIALDLGPKTIKLFKHYLRKSNTIVWNGPLGYFEWAKFSNSTKEIGRFIGKLTATTICGGGETTEAIKKFHLQHKLTHVSTGGGATLTYLSDKKMPGIIALEKNYQHYKNKILTR